MDRSRVMLVDDDPGLLRLLSYRLRSAGYDVEAVDSGVKALDKLPQFQPQVVITDLRMDGMDGMALFDTIHAERPSLPVIILTAHGTIPDAVEATQRGLHGYFTKPCDSERLLGCVDKALRISGGNGATDPSAWEDEIITRNPQMLATLERARLAARSDAFVLIAGERGTGKELLARTIHRHSTRGAQPFVTVDGNATPAMLLENEMLGAGPNGGLSLNAAAGGTLYLDDVGDLSPALQSSLVRLLKGKDAPEDDATADSSVRIISATRRDLEKDTASGTFREDLYYQLNVVGLTLASLTERRDDIPLLARHFLDQLAKNSGQAHQEFSPDAMELLLSAPWPGNVQQLQNIVQQTAALCTTPVIPRSLVAEALHKESRELPTLNEARSRFERQYLVRILRSTQGNVSHAARLAGRDRSKFYKLLHRHKLDPSSFRRAR